MGYNKFMKKLKYKVNNKYIGGNNYDRIARNEKFKINGGGI